MSQQQPSERKPQGTTPRQVKASEELKRKSDEAKVKLDEKGTKKE